LDLFAPVKDLPGQKAGQWYLSGTWTISKKGALEVSKQAGHSPDFVQGKIQTELTFNPLYGRRNWSAHASLPMSPATGRWGRGQGTFELSTSWKGQLFLDLTLWPEIEVR